MTTVVDYSGEPSGECVVWKTHYCFSIPYRTCLKCAVGVVKVHGHDTAEGFPNYTQYKPVWKRMQNRRGR